MDQPVTHAHQGAIGLYETLPYDSMPFAHTQPSNLAALATLFGHTPPNVGTARVLDLGCASGGNIVPLAARFPKAQFTGIDLSRRHVDIARERIAALGLTNIAIRQGDLAEESEAPTRFSHDAKETQEERQAPPWADGAQTGTGHY